MSNDDNQAINVGITSDDVVHLTNQDLSMSTSLSQSRAPIDYITPADPKSRWVSSKWCEFGVPIDILVIARAVVAAILATHHKHGSSSSSSSSSGNLAVASSAISAKNDVGIFPLEPTLSSWCPYTLYCVFCMTFVHFQANLTFTSPDKCCHFLHSNM
jgi:hypothetical protein